MLLGSGEVVESKPDYLYGERPMFWEFAAKKYQVQGVTALSGANVYLPLVMYWGDQAHLFKEAGFESFAAPVIPPPPPPPPPPPADDGGTPPVVEVDVFQKILDTLYEQTDALTSISEELTFLNDGVQDIVGFFARLQGRSE